MRKSLLALGVIVVAVASALAGPGKYNKVVAPGDKAPTFAGIQAVMGDKDTVVNLDDLKEDAVVLVFLANHCPYVTKVEDRLIDFANDYKDKNVKIVAVCVTPSPEYAPEGYNKEYCEADTLAKIKERVSQKKYPFAYGRDDTQKIGANTAPSRRRHSSCSTRNERSAMPAHSTTTSTMSPKSASVTCVTPSTRSCRARPSRLKRPAPPAAASATRRPIKTWSTR